MRWQQDEIKVLLPILEQVRANIGLLGEKYVLVLCSAAGDVAFYLSEGIGRGKIVGLETNDELLDRARETAEDRGLERLVSFQKAEVNRIAFPDETFDALVSEFIIFPTPEPTQIGQPEMARVLKAGGNMVLTDVILSKPIPESVRAAYRTIGLDYLCDATVDDFRSWMEEAGLTDVCVLDFTTRVRKVWEQRRATDSLPDHRSGYAYLLDDTEYGLGEAAFYIYVRGNKPTA